MALIALATPEQLRYSFSPRSNKQADISRQLAKLQLMCGQTGLKSVALDFADKQKWMREEIRHGACGPTGAQGPQGAQGRQASYVGLSADNHSVNKAKYYGVKS